MAADLGLSNYVECVRHDVSIEVNAGDEIHRIEEYVRFQLQLIVNMQKLLDKLQKRACFAVIERIVHCDNFAVLGNCVATCAVSGVRETNCVQVAFSDNVVFPVETGDCFDFLMRIYCYSHLRDRVLYNHDPIEVIFDEFHKAHLIVTQLIALL